jgi:DNA repair exonuclease SbcCD ATPase subunit
MAKAVLKGLMGEQKDIGKLKQNNEQLKLEMQSLRAMLAAQAKEDASNSKHTKELEEKQAEIDKLEKQISEIEALLSAEKAMVRKLEADLQAQKERAAQDLANAQSRAAPNPLAAPGSPKQKGKSPHHEPRISDADLQNMSLPTLPSNYASPDVVAKHRASVARLEDELKHERKLRRDADGEIIKLRAAINGVQLSDSEVEALLAQKLQESAPKNTERYVHVSLFSICRLATVVVLV